ncbi:hypothetical protein [Pseudomonas boanensis]|uniref:hypothetical protein n=1 Tax=Metapseudomonas boanensis TaxID=2822138 RepID=UPI0035D499DA
MNTQLKLLVAATLASATLVGFAAEEPKTTAPAETTASTPAVTEQAISEQMKKMQAAHDKVAAAKTPEERRAAMLESMNVMRESMGMMSAQSDVNCPGMGMGMSKGMGMGMGGGHMGMGQMMMKMMEQQSHMMGMPAK